jgi:hypothetical protein
MTLVAHATGSCDRELNRRSVQTDEACLKHVTSASKRQLLSDVLAVTSTSAVSLSVYDNDLIGEPAGTPNGNTFGEPFLGVCAGVSFNPTTGADFGIAIRTGVCSFDYSIINLVGYASPPCRSTPSRWRRNQSSVSG